VIESYEQNTCVTLADVGPHQAIDLKRHLEQSGLVMGVDFDWQFVPSQDDGFSGITPPRHVKFYFHDPAVATFYQLKWAQ
jgi:hypothetical protein